MQPPVLYAGLVESSSCNPRERQKSAAYPLTRAARLRLNAFLPLHTAGGEVMHMAKAKTTKTTKLQKLFGATAYSEATTRNYGAARAFVHGDAGQLTRVLMTGNFEHTFYASDAELAGEAIGLFRHFAATDPHFLAQAIIYARAEGLMRVAPITALVVLSAADSADAKELFRRIFPRVIQTPGDLQDAIALCRRSALRGMGKAV